MEYDLFEDRHIECVGSSIPYNGVLDNFIWKIYLIKE